LLGVVAGAALGYGCVRLWTELVIPESHRGFFRSEGVMRIGDVFFTMWQTTAIVLLLTPIALVLFGGGLIYVFRRNDA
jgi:hypothetical protein